MDKVRYLVSFEAVYGGEKAHFQMTVWSPPDASLEARNASLIADLTQGGEISDITDITWKAV